MPLVEATQLANEKKSTNDVMFFLGAGASVEADVPDTLKFIEDFEHDVVQNQDTDVQKAYKWMKSRLKESPRQLDLELLLESLERLQNDKLRKDVLSVFLSSPKELEDYRSSLESLNDLLREYVRKRMIVSPEETKHMDPIIAFVDHYDVLDVFSVNYDACIELLCDRHSIRYSDGFELYWDMELFGEDSSLNLFKLHGSITWWFSAKQETQFKLPIKASPRSYLELIDGQTVENLILYPTELKLATSRPIADITYLFREKLRSVKLVIVVGYTFRDPELKRIMIEGASTNPDLRFLLVSPHASRIYEKQLVHTALASRVGVIQRQFGEALEDHYLLRQVQFLPQAKARIESAKMHERDGNLETARSSYLQTATDLARLGFIFEARDILAQTLPEQYTSPPGDNDQRLVELFSYGLFVLLDGLDFEMARWWKDKLLDVVNKALEWSITYRNVIKELALLKRMKDLKLDGWEEKSVVAEMPDATPDDITILKDMLETVTAEDKSYKIMYGRFPKRPHQERFWTSDWFTSYLGPIEKQLRERQGLKVVLMEKRKELVEDLQERFEKVRILADDFVPDDKNFLSVTNQLEKEIQDLISKMVELASPA